MATDQEEQSSRPTKVAKRRRKLPIAVLTTPVGQESTLVQDNEIFNFEERLPPAGEVEVRERERERGCSTMIFAFQGARYA